MNEPPNPVPPPARTGWRRDAPADPTAGDRAGPRRVFVALLLLFSVGGGIAAVLTWAVPRPSASLVPFWVTETAGSDGPPPFLGKDQSAILRSGLFVRTASDAAAVPTRSALESRLRDIGQVSAGRPAVVYVSGRAVCDRAGAVVILAADTPSERPQDGVSLKLLLESLRESRARNKLLVLDLFWPAADVATALTAGTVAGRIPEELDAVDDPDRLVLCSCGPGQVALASEDLGRTVFGFYFEEGLRGWAAPAGSVAVTAKDLARFVQTRVRRWAEQNREVRQTPTFYGDAGDFPLVAVRGGRPAEHLEPVATPDYPAWLRDQWFVRDRYRNQGVERSDPLTFRRLEAAILSAETEWRGGGDANAVRRRLQDEVTRLSDVITRHSAFPADTRPPNLASRTGPPDPALTDTVREYLRVVASAKPEDAAKATSDLAVKLRAKPAADAARVLFDVAAADRNPSPETIRRLDDLVRSLDPRPRLIETVFLSRLAEAARSASPGEWPAATAARALAVVRLGERATRPEVFPVVADLFDQASRERFAGESILLPLGYAPAAEADRHLIRAEELFRRVIRVQDACDAADSELARALPLISSDGDRGTALWKAASDDARTLADTRQTVGRPGEDLMRVCGVMEGLTLRLSMRLASLTERYQPEKIKELLATAKKPDPTPERYRELESLLSAPYLPADSRAQVWQALREVGGKLSAATIEADHADVQSPPTSDPIPSYRSEWEADEQAERDRRSADLVAFVSLVRMAGLPVPKPLLRFGGAAGEIDDEPAHRVELAAAVRNAWSAAPAPGQLDRVARVLPPRLQISGTTGVGEPASLRLPDSETAALHAWLAGWYGDRAADAAADGLFATTALEYRLAARSVPPSPPRVSVSPPSLALTPARSASADLRVELPVAKRSRGEFFDLLVALLRFKVPENVGGFLPEISIVGSGSGWLDVGFGSPRAGEGTGSGIELPLAVKLKPGAGESAKPPPHGFLVRLRSGGRDSYLRVPVDLSKVRERLELFFSPDPAEPTSPSSGVTVRPGGTRQVQYLYLRNPGDRQRSLIAEIGVNEKVFRVPLRIPPGSTTPLRLTPPSPKTDAAPVPAPPPPQAKPAEQLLEELGGPIVLRVLDTERNNELVFRTEVRPEVYRPSAYVRIASARISPPGPETNNKNRLEVVLRPAGPLPPPPARAELVVMPADLTAPGPPLAGTLRGDIPPKGELHLFADGVTPSPDGGVRFWVNIDGVERVFLFRAFVPATGDPISPRPLTETSLTLVAPHAVPSGPRYPVRVVVDHPPLGSSVTVGLGRLTAGGLQADVSKAYPAPVHHRIGWGLTADGGLAFDAAVRDWVAEFDVSQVRGRRVVRAGLFDSTGAEIRSVAIPIVLDDQPADKVGFVELPKQAQLGGKLGVKAVGKADVAGIKEVTFFVGKPAEGKLPPGVTAVPGKPTDPNRTTWGAELTLPKERAGPVELGARFVTETGVTTFAAATVDLVDYDPAKTAPGKITGVVMEGEVPQVGLEVVLSDDKGAEKGKAKSSQGGAFAFGPVPPGTYKLVATKRLSGAEKVAIAEVKLAPGGDEKRRLDLYLKGK